MYRTRFVPLVTVLLLVSLVVTLVSVGSVYQFSLDAEQVRLSEMVKSQKDFIDAILGREDADLAGQNASVSGHSLVDKDRVLRKIVSLLTHLQGFGKTGEFVLGRQEGNNIVFLTKPRYLDHPIPPTPIDSVIAEPMRRALMGKSGMMTGIDYRSETVIAAHETIPQMGLGLVAKIDLAEFRAPFVTASVVASGISVFFIVLGVLLLRQIEDQVPKVRSLEQSFDQVSIISNRERFTYFVLIMLAIAMVITATSVMLLYDSSYEAEKSHLLQLVETKTNLIGEMVSADSAYGQPERSGHYEKTYGPFLMNALGVEQHFGKTGEFVVGKRDGDQIVFLSPSRHLNTPIPPVQMTDRIALPMQQALMGKSDVIVGLDYRSVKVLAAYGLVPHLNLGLVAKVDLSEIQEPFIQASLLSFGISLVVVVFGALYLGKWGKYVDVLVGEEPIVRRRIYGFDVVPTAKTSRILIVFVVGLMAAIFALDLMTPLGIAGGVLYVSVVLVGWWFPCRRHTVILAVLSSVLTFIGFLYSIEGSDPFVVLTNRGYALVVIWVTALTVSLGKASDLARTKQAYELSKLSLAVEHSPSSVIITDPKGVIEYVNQKFTAVTGFPSKEVVGGTFDVIKSGQTPKTVFKDLWSTITQGREWHGEIINKKKNGEIYWESVGILPIKSRYGEIQHYVALQEDITDRKRAEEQLKHMANHDVLTGLPTRRLGTERISRALALARRENSKVAVMFVDLDGFKIVNDTLGHDAGDALLAQVGARLLDCVREVDTVARIGGDEFVVVLGGIETQDNAASVAQKLVDTLAQPFLLGADTATIGASIGIALYPDHAQTPETLLMQADKAMYEVKKSGKNAFSFAHCDDV